MHSFLGLFCVVGYTSLGSLPRFALRVDGIHKIEVFVGYNSIIRIETLVADLALVIAV